MNTTAPQNVINKDLKIPFLTPGKSDNYVFQEVNLPTLFSDSGKIFFNMELLIEK